jgi:hypothetical protein
MGLIPDVQLFNEDFVGVLNARYKTTAQTKNEKLPIPAIITKKWLADRMECTCPNGEINRDRLYKYVLTHEVLQKIGLRAKEVRQKSFKCFDRLQSIALTQILDL